MAPRDNLTQALAYADLGWPIFPVWPMRGDACGCGGSAACNDGKNAGKHPVSDLVPKGHLNATTNRETIKQWWTQVPDANIGLYCAGAGLVVADIDPRNGGNESWAALGEPDSTVIAETGGGGEHHFYLAPGDEWMPSSASERRGIDLKHEGYVILAPSNHRSGERYAWMEDSDPFSVDLDAIPELPSCFISDQPGNASPSAEKATFEPGELDRLLADIPIDRLDDYYDWVSLGQALHHQFDGDEVGFDLWVEHSRRSEKFDDNLRAMRSKWRSFGRSRRTPITMRSVIQWVSEDRQARFAASLVDAFEDLPDEAADGETDYDALIGLPSPAAPKSVADELADFDSNDADDPEESSTASDSDWVSLLDFNEEGGIKVTLHNIETIVLNDPRFAGLPQLNEFTQETVQRRPPGIKAPRRRNAAKPTRQLQGRVWEVKDPLNGDLWSDAHDSSIRSILEAPKAQGGYSIKVTDRDLKAAIDSAAHKNAFHPVREYLNGLTWDGTPRVETLFIDYLGANNNAYTRAVARLTMVAAVTRIFEPGAKFDFAVILEGAQGKRKSTFIRILGRHWFAELDGDFSNTKQMIELMQGAWIVEIPELSGMLRSEVLDIKAFISRQTDKARLSYARRAREFPRQSILVGSTNDQKYLKDDTGGRRFWPIACTVDVIETARLEAEIDQLWAEAVILYRAMREKQPHGTLPLYLTGTGARLEAERLQESRRIETPDDAMAGRIAAWLDRPVSSGDSFTDGVDGGRQRNETCLLQIWLECLGGAQATYTSQITGSLSRAMRRLPDWIQAGQHRFPEPYGKQRYYARGGLHGVIERGRTGEINALIG